MPSGEQARKTADLMDREKRKLELRGLRSVNRLLREVRVEVAKAFRRSQDPVDVFSRRVEAMTPLVTDGLMVGHLQGRLRMLRSAAAAQRRNVKLAGTVYDDALEFLRARLNLDEDALAVLREQYGRRAVHVLGEANAVGERELLQAVERAVREGVHVDAGTSIIRGAFERGGAGAQNPFIYETLFRTQIQLAYSAGRANAAEDPAIDEILWGWEYVTVGDDRVRPNHVLLDGTTLPKDHPQWASITPPNGYNCRCTAIEVFDRGEVVNVPEPQEVDGQLTEPGADRGWEFNPGALYRDTLRAA